MRRVGQAMGDGRDGLGVLVAAVRWTDSLARLPWCAKPTSAPQVNLGLQGSAL
jgi:hypothetical protein